MLHFRAHSPTLLIVGVVAALLVAESNCFPTQLSAQQIIDKDLGASEAILSMIVNQVAVLKLLNESSTVCSLHERELQERLNRSIDLDVKTQQVKNELQEAKEAALLQIKHEMQATKEAAILELKNMTMATMNAMNSTNEETRMVLNEVKETVVNVSRQAAIMASQDCENGWTKYQLSCYKVFKTEANNAEAAANCRSVGAHLATIGSEGENSFVTGLITRQSFIGLYDKAEEGVWTWEDGSPFSYSNWESGQPNNDGDCVELEESDSKWWDRDCTESRPYICEKSLV